MQESAALPRWCPLALALSLGCSQTPAPSHVDPEAISSPSASTSVASAPSLASASPSPSASASASAGLPAEAIGASLRLSGKDAYVDAVFPCEGCSPPALRLGQAVGVRALRLIDLEGEPIKFRTMSDMAGALTLRSTAGFPGLLCMLQRGSASEGTYWTFVIVSLRNRQPKVLYADEGGHDLAFVRGKTAVLDFSLVQSPRIPGGYTGMPPHPRTLTYQFDGKVYINVGNDRGGPTLGPSISL